MKSIVMLVLVALGLAFTAIGSAWAAVDVTPSAIVSKLDGTGTAKVRRKAGIESAVGVGQKIFPGDRLVTDAKSIVELSLADGTLVRVGLNSEYRIETVEKKAGIFSWVFELGKGSIRALVEKSPDKKTVKFRVNTPSGTMGVRGTELVLEHSVKSKITTLYTIEGRVQFGARDCVEKKTCIEVNTGEQSSISSSQHAPSSAAPFKGKDVLGYASSGASTGPGSASGGAGTNGASALGGAGDPAAMMERLERAALFEDLKKAEVSSKMEALDGLDDIVKAASEKMAAAQDTLLGRTKEIRDKMHAAMDDGTYNNKINLAEKFDDLTSGTKKSAADRDEEKNSGEVTAKKFAVADAVLASGKYKVPDSLVQSAAARASQLADLTKKVTAAKALLSTTRTSGASLAAGASLAQANQDLANAQSAQLPVVEPQMPKEVVQDLLEDKVLSTAVSQYSDSYQYLKKCGGFLSGLFGCGDVKIDGTKYDIKNGSVTRTVTTTITRTSGVCYQTKKVCGKELLPCDLSKGKLCRNTYVGNDKCTDTQVQVDCPAASSTGNGGTSGAGTNNSGTTTGGTRDSGR